MKLINLVLGITLVLQAASALAGEREVLPYPPTTKGSAVQELHGVKVADPYRWLEDLRSAETKKWMRDEDALLKKYLAFAKDRSWFEERIRALNKYDLYSSPQLLGPPVVKRGSRVFFLKTAAGKSVAVLHVREGSNTRVLLDPEAHYPEANRQIVTIDPSPDGRYVACGIAEGLSRWITLKILDADSGKEVETLNGLHNVGAGVVWQGDGFFYVAFDAEGKQREGALKNPRIMKHSINHDQSRDSLTYSRPGDDQALYSMGTALDGKLLIIEVRQGSARETEVLYKDLSVPDGKVQPLIPAKADYHLLGSYGNRLFFYTDQDAPLGKVISIDPASPAPSTWKTTVPESTDAIAGRSSVGGNALGMFNGRLVLMYLSQGKPFLRIFDAEGNPVRELSLPTGGSIWGGLSGSASDPEVFYQYLGLTHPSTIYSLNVSTLSNSVFLQARADFDADSYVVEQVFFTSRDKTKVPMFVAYKRGLKRDGSHPTWMYGYGAFGWVSFVWYQPQMLAWLDIGGVFAVPGIRGGGEFGEQWHRAGMKENRQNAIDDFVAAGKWLIAEKFTSPSLLVANGGSASGAIAAAAIQQQPKLFGAAIIDRPILDLIRFDQFPAGAYWTPEFGSPANPVNFKVLLSYSPYHKVQANACYPPTLVMSGTSDKVADPSHAYKFTARMQAAQSCKNPVLLKLMWEAGHNFGTTPEQIVDSWSDALAFLGRALNLQTPTSTLTGRGAMKPVASPQTEGVGGSKTN